MTTALVNFGLALGFAWSGDAQQIEHVLQGAIAPGDPFAGGVVPDDVPGPAVVDGTAIVRIEGVLVNRLPAGVSIANVTAYASIAGQVHRALADGRADRIALVVDSPGGAVDSGLPKTAAVMREARRRKPVTAYVGAWATGAAYLLVAQAGKVIAAPTSIVGGIGVFSVYSDSSEAFDKAGVKAHVIRSGPHKGMAAPGSFVTPEQLRAEEENIEAMTQTFIQDVAAGRGLTIQHVRQAATGQLWNAATAKATHLVDTVEPIPEQFS